MSILCKFLRQANEYSEKVKCQNTTTISPLVIIQIRSVAAVAAAASGVAAAADADDDDKVVL